MAKCIYRERVRPPRELLCAVACIVGIALCWSSYSTITASLASMPPPVAVAIAFLFISLSGYIVGMLTFGVRIKVTTGGGIGYEQGVVFSTLGTGHSGRLYVLALTRFHGVFAPNSKHRIEVTPARRGKGRRRNTAGEEQCPSPAERRASMTWAQRLKRVFNIDIETCSKCGGAVRVIACIRLHGCRR